MSNFNYLGPLHPLRIKNNLTDFSNNIERLFLSAFDPFNEGGITDLNATTASYPRIDIKEESKEYTIYADVPGVTPENIFVTVNNGVLTIKAHQENEVKDERTNYLRVERYTSSFMRQISLPETVDTNNVKAKCNNGVLTITLQKTDKSNLKKILVEK